MARAAFLFVIGRYDSFKFNKKEMLEEIVQKCPEVLEVITDDELLQGFKQHIANNNRGNAVTSTADMKWISRYIKDEGKRYEAEKMLFTALLLTSWGKMRREFNWTISAEDCIQLVRDALKDQNSQWWQCKMDLAIEFGEPADEYARNLYCKLLYENEYDAAAALGIKDSDDITITVVTNMVCNGFLRHADRVAKRFLPHRKDIIDEVEQLKTCLDY